MRLTMAEWARLSEKPGSFKVTRWCCRYGNCETCRTTVVVGKRRRVVQMEGLNAEAAEVVRQGWEEYGAEIEEGA